jgi:hypothetical protein
VGPGGPDVWVIEEGASEWVPADWRRLDGFKFEIPVRLARIDGLPEPPDRDLREMLKEKIETLRLVMARRLRFSRGAFPASTNAAGSARATSGTAP